MTTMTEPLEMTEQDTTDIIQLYAEEDGQPPTYHPILQVWREVLKPAREVRNEKVTPQWANRIVSSYQEVTFADMPEVHERYYGKVLELLEILEFEIASDSDCLSYDNAEDDVEFNGYHYKNLLLTWQMAFLQWELDWDCADEWAPVELAAISEVYKMFFGQTGLTQFLDNIRFEFTEGDQAELAEALEELKVASRE